MRSNLLLEKIRAGQVVLGLGYMYPASGMIEGMCRNWDFVWIDGQHGQISYDSALHAVQAADAMGIESVLRVPGHEFGIVGPFADLAPSAIMVPMVNNAHQARNVVSHLRFPPLGIRSFGGRRVIDLDGRDYYRDRELMVIAQIETLEAVEHAESIINTEGIDMLFFGPDDMKVRMDIQVDTPYTDNKLLREAMAKVAAAARAAGKSCGNVAATAETLRMSVDMGYQLIIGGSDAGFLRTASARTLAELRKVIDDGPTTETISPTTGSVYGC